MTRAHGKVTIIFYCEDINSTYRIWSPWIKLLFFQYVPRISALSASTPFWFIFSLQHEFAEGALAYSVFQFDLVWKGAQVNIIQEIGKENVFIENNFFGEVSIQGYFHQRYFQNSPFSACFRENPP